MAPVQKMYFLHQFDDLKRMAESAIEPDREGESAILILTGALTCLILLLKTAMDKMVEVDIPPPEQR